MTERGSDSKVDLRSLYNILDLELKKASYYKNVVTLIFIKINDFDQIGRSYGSFTASHLFKDIKRLVCQSIRSDDQGLTCGSDELIIILPNTPKEGAARIASKLQRLVESFTFNNGKGTHIRLTPKVGIASYCYSEGAGRQLTGADK